MRTLPVANPNHAYRWCAVATARGAEPDRRWPHPVTHWALVALAALVDTDATPASADLFSVRCGCCWRRMSSRCRRPWDCAWASDKGARVVDRRHRGDRAGPSRQRPTDLEINATILAHALGKEGLAPRARVVRDVAERVANVLQVGAIVLHRAVASARIRGSR